MPIQQSATTMPSKIKIIDPVTSKSITYEVQQKLGEGLFSDVHRVTDPQGNSFALKAIKLNNSHLTKLERAELMRIIKKEVSILKELNMLNGYKKYKNTVLILQPYLGGQSAFDKFVKIDRGDSYFFQIENWSENSKIIKECFLALLKIHEKNIVHMDPHANNFIYRNDNALPTLIDFGFAQRKNKYNTIEDLCQFLIKFVPLAQANGDARFAKTLANYYMEATLEYLKQNKKEVAFNIFYYGVISIATIYGLGTFAAVQTLMWSYCKTIALDFTADWFSSILQRNQAQLIAQKCAGAKNDLTTEAINHGCTFGHIVVSSLLFWGIYRSYQSPLSLLEKLATLTAENSPLSQAFWSSAMNAISTLEICDAALFYYPASNTYKYLSDVFEATFGTENSLAKDCENITYSKGWMQHFNLFASKTANQKSSAQETERGTPDLPRSSCPV